MLLLKLDSSCNMHIFKYRYKNLKHFEKLFTSRNHRLLRVCAPLYVGNTAIWRKKEENCLTPDGSKQLKIQSSGALSDMGYIFSEQSNRLRRQQGITYTGAGQLWFCWWTVLSRASQVSGMVQANNNYLSETVNCPENEYKLLQHRNEELQFLLNHFSMS